jgi:putative ribosome biogenesis GTPase RsgA
MSEEKWIPTSNILMDTLFKEGIPKDKLTLLVGQSGVGNSYLFKMQKSWIRSQNRKETIKRLFI